MPFFSLCQLSGHLTREGRGECIGTYIYGSMYYYRVDAGNLSFHLPRVHVCTLLACIWDNYFSTQIDISTTVTSTIEFRFGKFSMLPAPRAAGGVTTLICKARRSGSLTSQTVSATGKACMRPSTKEQMHQLRDSPEKNNPSRPGQVSRLSCLARLYSLYVHTDTCPCFKLDIKFTSVQIPSTRYYANCLL